MVDLGFSATITSFLNLCMHAYFLLKMSSYSVTEILIDLANVKHRCFIVCHARDLICTITGIRTEVSSGRFKFLLSLCYGVHNLVFIGK